MTVKLFVDDSININSGRENHSLCRFSILHRFYTDMITDFTPSL